jgi:hypothetical protein
MVFAFVGIDPWSLFLLSVAPVAGALVARWTGRRMIGILVLIAIWALAALRINVSMFD